jgi:hypothetical protein
VADLLKTIIISWALHSVIDFLVAVVDLVEVVPEQKNIAPKWDAPPMYGDFFVTKWSTHKRSFLLPKTFRISSFPLQLNNI